MGLNLQDLRCYVISGQGVPAGYEDIYQKAYEMWKQVWSETFVELNKTQKLFSDTFTRQTKIVCVFVGDKCATLVACREVDISNRAQREDSLLSAWDDEAFDLLTVDGNRVSIASNLTVAKEFRGEIAPEMSFKLLSVLMSTHYLLDSDCDVMTGTMRCNRGTDKSAYTSGARFIKRAQMNGSDADLVGFFKKEIQAQRLNTSNVWSETLWRNRVDLTTSVAVTKTDKKTA